LIPNIAYEKDPNATVIWPVTLADYDAWLATRSSEEQSWLNATGFEAKDGSFALMPGAGGSIDAVVLGLGDGNSIWSFGDLSGALPAGSYYLDDDLAANIATDAVVAWSLGSYVFDQYKDDDRTFAVLVAPSNADIDYATATVNGANLARDLINTPAADMAPGDLAEAASELARKHGGKCQTLVGDELLMENFPAIHAVGRASINYPRLIDLTWGDSEAPKVTLVGKGVCFDTGGLDLKPSAAMLKMKKDMGGAATVLGIAEMVMATKLPVRLRVLIPAVENSVSGAAYRPGDILQTRKGLTVEVGNTDAEGRIVLCDALAEADFEIPDLLIDMATLTGAARVALGTDLPALFTDDDDLAAAFAHQGKDLDDPLWRLPLYTPYRELLNSKIADINNVSEGAFGGAITAALYLKEFVSRTKSWAHIDTYGWNDKARPGRPTGGHPLAMRSIYGLIKDRYGAN
jgi:leucyl aminopeptidase